MLNKVSQEVCSKCGKNYDTPFSFFFATKEENPICPECAIIGTSCRIAEEPKEELTPEQQEEHFIN